MPQMYDMVMKKGGVVGYRVNKQFIKKEKVPVQVLSVLTLQNIVDENALVIVDEKAEETKTEETPNENASVVDNDESSDSGSDDDGSEDDSEPAEPSAPAAPAPVSQAAPAAEAPAPTPRPRVSQAPARNAVGPEFKSKVPQSKSGMGFPRFNGKTADIFDGQTAHSRVKFVGGVMVPLSEANYKTRTDGEILDRLKDLGIRTIDFEAIESQNGNSSGGIIDERDEEENLNLR